MAPSSKAKAAGVSASSFLDLKSELAKQESEFAKKKTSGRSYVVGGVDRPDKKATVWARPNKGVMARNTRDLQMEEASKQTIESARAALERKAQIYDKLKKGKTGGLTDAQYDALLVDFDSKPATDHYSSDSDDVDESLTVPKPLDDDDPVVEYEDEFGRIRTARRSEVPREHMRPAELEEEIDDDPYVVRNPTNFFPVFEPSAERIAAIEAAASEAANPLATHYDAKREVRAKGAAFYSFSADEEARAREMEELKRTREETERARREAGAVDVKPGEVEGMVDGEGGGEGNEERGGDEGKGKGKEAVLAARSRAVEKRKREIEERRKLVEAKRRKMKGGEAEMKTGDPQQQKDGSEAASTAVPSNPVDPFEAFEAKVQGGKVKEGKGKQKSRWDKAAGGEAGPATALSVNAADDFLAQLEKDLVKG